MRNATQPVVAEESGRRLSRGMPEKGSYRSVYSAIWDDPEFQSFKPITQLVFFALRTAKDCNFPCLFVFYPSILHERLPNVPSKGIEEGIGELIGSGWIQYERPVLWVVKGFKNDPHRVPHNSKQIQGLVSILKTLPKLKIVESFAEYYEIPFKYDAPIHEAIHEPPMQGEGRRKRKTFSPPSIEEVREYCKERGNGIDAEGFIDAYTAKGWLIGKTPMKDWKAAVRTWEKREKETKSENRKCEFRDCTYPVEGQHGHRWLCSVHMPR